MTYYYKTKDPWTKILLIIVNGLISLSIYGASHWMNNIEKQLAVLVNNNQENHDKIIRIEEALKLNGHTP